jgi:hypothetical protein
MICEFYTSIGIILSYAISMSHISRSTTHLLPASLLLLRQQLTSTQNVYFFLAYLPILFEV